MASAFLLVAYRALLLLPQRNRIVCLSRQSNAEPVDFKMIKAHFAEHDQSMEVAILAKTLDNKLEYSFHVIKQVFYIATSKAVLLDSYCLAIGLLHGKIRVPVIQMWHAMGNMKKFGYSAIGSAEGRTLEQAQLLGMHRGYDSVLISSNSFSADYAEGFGIDPAIIFEAPLPKADLLLSAQYREQKRSEILSAYPHLGEKPNIVYCPTFRRNPADNESEAMQELLDAVDFEKYNLIFKKHPVSNQRFSDERVLQDYPSELDMLFIADFVISDYSTVIYEAGLLGLPVFLYAYDWNSYQEKRSLNIDLEHSVPALFTDNPREIIRAIESEDFNLEEYGRFMQDHIRVPESGSCTERVAAHVLDLINASK